MKRNRPASSRRPPSPKKPLSAQASSKAPKPASPGLRDKAREDLLALAKQKNIRGLSRMTKAQLIQALMPLTTPKKGKERAASGIIVPEAAPKPSLPRPRLMRSYEALPENYGVTELILLPVDPHWVHAYWEVTPQTLSGVLTPLGLDTTHVRYLLRIYDVTAIEFNGKNAHSFFDLPVELSARNWYVNLWSSEKSLVADLGFLLPDGRFFMLVRSNVVQTPRAGVSIFTDAPWAEPSHDPARFRFRSREPRYGPLPRRLTPSGRKLPPPARRGQGPLWDKLREQSQMLTRGVLHPSSPGARRISS